MSKEIIIHLGLPKTGTTTLQKRIFPKHDEYFYLGKHYPTRGSNSNEMRNWLRELSIDLVRKDLPYFKEYKFDQILTNNFGSDIYSHSRFFLSEENFLDRCMTPGKYADSIRIGSAYSMIKKLKVILDNSLFSSVKVILIIRKQDDLLESIFAEEYDNYSSYWGMKTPEDFIQYLFNEGLMEETDSLLRYHSFIKYLDSLFGRDNVLILTYESMKTNPDGFMRQLSKFMQIDLWKNSHLIKTRKDNVRDYEGGEGKVAKTRSPSSRVGELIGSNLGKIKHKIFGDVKFGIIRYFKFLNILQKKVVIELDEENRKKILSHYEVENRKLIDRVNHLSEYGYFSK